MLRHTCKRECTTSHAVPDEIAENDLAVWKDIPGYLYKYRISDYGVVQRYTSIKGWTNMSPYKHGGKRRTRVAVKMTISKGKYKNVYVNDLMAELFLGGRDAHPGMVLVHKNHNSFDCSAHNLEWVTLSEVGKRCGSASSRPVEKVNRLGEVVDIFSSSVECCAREFISRKTLWRIMTGKCSDPFFTTGYTYRYEEGRVYHGQKKTCTRKAHNSVS